MKVLLVSSFLPYPLFSGGHIRLFNLLKNLSSKYEVTLICEKRAYQTDQDIAEVRKLCKKVIVVDRKKQWSLKNILYAGFSMQSFLMVGHANNEMKIKIEKLLQETDFDLIHVETFYVYQNLPETQIPIVVVEHNVEYLVYGRYIQSAPLFLKPFLYMDVMKLKREEEKIWKKATALVAVSSIEANIMREVRSDVGIVPNGVDTLYYVSSRVPYSASKKEKRLLFIGDFKWIQNRNAAEWLIKEIWPFFAKTSEGKPEIKLWVVGRKIPNSIKQLTSDLNVIFDENASSDTRKIYAKSDLLLAPIRVGGGTSYKILEAMASGIPVITTPLGVEGIEARDNKELLIGTDMRSLAEKTITVLQDQNVYSSLSKNARKLIEEKYDWRIIIKKLEEVYDSVVQR